jgi:hypothetical protein
VNVAVGLHQLVELGLHHAHVRDVLSTDWPRSPADSIVSTPQPRMRSRKLWLIAWSLTRMSGISRRSRENTPNWKMMRSLVNT